MSTVELNNETLPQAVHDNDYLIIDFWGDWCAPCKRFAPTYEKLSEEFPNVKFAKIDAGSNPEVLQSLKIQHVPTILFVERADAKVQVRGAVSETAFREALYTAFPEIANSSK